MMKLKERLISCSWKTVMKIKLRRLLCQNLTPKAKNKFYHAPKSQTNQMLLKIWTLQKWCQTKKLERKAPSRLIPLQLILPIKWSCLPAKRTHILIKELRSTIIIWSMIASWLILKQLLPATLRSIKMLLHIQEMTGQKLNYLVVN